ncbi:outer membrane protein Iml2/Tetratricopeptide repeat protein 39 [Daedaleopsis nitida]|nr:outer membrane protein Iml2/Tetratricopeptide repeat protein 39 [Daedaleopsis nitida]
MDSPPNDTEAQLRAATVGFDQLFANDLHKARDTFAAGDSPFHALGHGVCAFLEAALGMETGLMAEASRLLALSEAGSKKYLKLSKYSSQTTQFPPGTEWELLHSDAVILLGLTHALSESYMGYIQCLYAMNSAHSKYTKLYKTVYPNGLDDYATPAASAPGSSAASIRSVGSATNSVTPAAPKSTRSGFFSRFTGSTLTVPTVPTTPIVAAEGSLDELILSGTAFGYGLFNLVFSLLPAKVRGVVGFLGFNHDRKLALRALAVSAAKTDVHAVFAGLSLMTYHGVVLLLAGYQADEEHILKQYRAIVDKLELRYPTGSLWILNRAKILRMSYDPEGAIKVLQDGLAPGLPHTFAQADGLLLFELAWTLLSQRRYQEAADAFIGVTEINSWSHATYYFIAAGCYISLRKYEKAQELLDKVPELIEKRKIGGKDLPTEVFIKKKIAFYKEKREDWTGSEDEYALAATISPAEELALFWNTHARITRDTAMAHIKDWATCLQTPPAIKSDLIESVVAKDHSTPPGPPDTPDELAIRSLLLGIVHRTAEDYVASRAFLEDAIAHQPSIKVSTWVGGVALFEIAVLDLKEMEVGQAGKGRETTGLNADTEGWARVLKGALEKLDKGLGLATQNVDLSSRLDSRIAMLKDEIVMKKELLGIVP